MTGDDDRFSQMRGELQPVPTPVSESAPPPPDNVLPFKHKYQPISWQSDGPVEGSYVIPDDSRDVVSLARDAYDDRISVIVLRPPDGMTAWEIDNPDDVDRLAVHLIQLGLRMRLRIGVPP